MKSSCCLASDMEQDLQVEKCLSIMFKDNQQHYKKEYLKAHFTHANIQLSKRTKDIRLKLIFKRKHITMYKEQIKFI